MVDSPDENPLEYQNAVAGGAMNNSKALLLIAVAILLAVGCKKNEEQAVLPPPVETSAIADTTSILPAETLAAVEEAPGMPPAPKGNGYAVQVASTIDAAYVLNQVDLWKRRGYEPFVTTTTHDNRTHYRIRFGLFATKAEARKVADELADKYSVKSWIDQMSN